MKKCMERWHRVKGGVCCPRDVREECDLDVAGSLVCVLDARQELPETMRNNGGQG